MVKNEVYRGDTDDVARVQPGRLDDAIAIEEDAVDASQIDDPVRFFPLVDDRMVARNLSLADDDVIALGPADTTDALEVDPVSVLSFEPSLYFTFLRHEMSYLL